MVPGRGSKWRFSRVTISLKTHSALPPTPAQSLDVTCHLVYASRQSRQCGIGDSLHLCAYIERSKMSVRAVIGKSQGAGLEGRGANMDTVSAQVLVLQRYCLGLASRAFRSPPKAALDLIDSFLWLRGLANQSWL